MSLSFIQTRGSAVCWWMAGPGSRRLASLRPFLGASTWCVSATDHEAVEVVQHLPGGELIVVCQCHRSCRYVEVASLFGVLPQAQFLDKVVDMPVASMTGASNSVHRQSVGLQCAQ